MGNQLFGVGQESHPLGQDYWHSVLLYVLSMLDSRYASEEKVVSLFIEKLTKPKQEVMVTLLQQITNRVRPELERKLKRELAGKVRAEGIQQGMERCMKEEKKAIAKNLLSNGLSISLISQVTGLSRQVIAKLGRD